LLCCICFAAKKLSNVYFLSHRGDEDKHCVGIFLAQIVSPELSYDFAKVRELVRRFSGSHCFKSFRTYIAANSMSSTRGALCACGGAASTATSNMP
jgi:hypothetical protein